MKSIATKVDDFPKRQEGSKLVTSILFNMFGRDSSKRVLSENDEHNSITTRTTSDIIALDKNNNKIKSTCTSSRTSKFLSHVFRKKFVIDGVRNTSRLSLLRRAISAKRRAAKREEEGGDDKVAVVNELCKRRILMGMKCKPVNASGKLHYGQDGVILHED